MTIDNIKHHLTILWSGLWRMLLFTVLMSAYITLCLWLEIWSLVLIFFTFFLAFSYMVGTLIGDDTYHSPFQKNDDEK